MLNARNDAGNASRQRSSILDLSCRIFGDRWATVSEVQDESNSEGCGGEGCKNIKYSF